METAVLARLIRKATRPFPSARVALLAGLAGAVTFASASLGKRLLSDSPEAWPLWPGCAALVSVLLLMPRKSWRLLIPAGLAGFLLADALIGLPLRFMLVVVGGEGTAILVGVFGVRTFLGRPRLNSLRALAIYCLFNVFLAALIAALFAAVILPGAYLRHLGIVFLAEALSFLTLTPAVLGWAWQLRAGRSAGWYAEMSAMLAGAFALSYFIFIRGPVTSAPVLMYLLAPFLIWAALRFGSTGVASACCIVAAFTIWGAIHDHGPFGGPPGPLYDVASLQLFLLAITVPFLVLAVLVEQHHEASRALQASESRERTRAKELEAVLDTAPVAIFIATDPGCTQMISNRAGYELLKAQPGTNVSKSAPHDEQPGLKVMRDGREVAPKDLPMQVAAATGGSASGIPLTLRLADGTERSVLMNTAPLWGEDGRLRGSIGTMVDLTEQKRAESALRESEERLRLATRAGRMYAFQWEKATDELIRSPECAELLGPGTPLRTTRTEVLSRIHPEDRQACDSAGLSPEHPGVRVRFRVARQDGGWIWMEKTAQGIFDGQGNLERVVGMMADITERKAAEEALASVSQRLIEAHEEERTWIARELHDDINQRLALLAIELEQLMRSPPASTHEIRRNVRSVWERLSEITNDIQAISHRFHSSKLEYLGIVAAARGFCRELMEQRKVTIHFKESGVPDSVPREVALCLFRVLQEALHNALKNSGVCEFGVELSGSEAEIRLVVSDAGRGFDPEAAMKAHGIGLISMRERLRLVNGEIRIDSRPNCGTRIEARVPLVSAKTMTATAG
jgi:signal transduction histidine kinase